MDKDDPDYDPWTQNYEGPFRKPDPKTSDMGNAKMWSDKDEGLDPKFFKKRTDAEIEKRKGILKVSDYFSEQEL